MFDIYAGYSDQLKHRIYAALLPCVFILASCRQVHKEPTGNRNHTDSIITRSNSIINSGQLVRGMAYFDSAYRAFPNPGTSGLWEKYNWMATYYLNYDVNTHKAQLYADSMSAVLNGKEKSYQEEYARTLYTQGDILVKERKYTEAFKQYYDGRVYAQQYLDSCRFSQFTYHLGLVRYYQGQYQNAIPYLMQAFLEISHCKDNTDFNNCYYFPQNYLNTIALSFEHSDKPDSAVYYYRRALTFIDQRGPLFPERKQDIAITRGIIYGNLGGVYAMLNSDSLAEKYLRKSIQINDRPGYAVGDAQTAKIKLASLYLRQMRYRSTDTLLRQIGLELSKRSRVTQDYMHIWLRWYRLQRDYYDKTHQPQQAISFAQKYDHLQDSLSRLNEVFQSANIDEAFKDSEQRYRLTLLSKDNKLKTAYLLMAITFLVMTVIILLIVGYNLKRYRKVYRLATEKNTQLQKTLAALEQSQAENTRMMKIVAHDLRNPIGAIKMAATLIMRKFDDSEEDCKMLEIIKKSADNSLDMVDELLQVHTNAEELQREPVDLSQMLHYCVDLLHHKAETKGQQIELRAKPVTLSVNREKLWRVISNLIANAVKFSPAGTKILVYMQEKNDHVLIAVKDQGIGIPSEMKDKIFDMFTEAKRIGTAGEQAFGLGLAISKQIVEAHAGRIWFKSEPGNGTTFFVELPVT